MTSSDYDVIIIGAGIAGLVTANRAAELGKRAVVLEKSTEDKYICMTYIDVISSKAVILSIEPATLYEGCAVVSFDGKKLGTVKRVNRVGVTNTVASITVSRGWFRTMDVKHADIKHFGTSILLSKTREQVKRDASKH